MVLWDPSAILDAKSGGKNALLAKMQKHTGAVSDVVSPPPSAVWFLFDPP